MCGWAGWRSSSRPGCRSCSCARGRSRCCTASSTRMAVHQQTFRTVNLLGARGAIVDDRRRLIAGRSGHVVIDADAASLGSRNAHGVWSPSPAGLRALRRLARVTGRRWGILAARIRHDVLQAPFAPAVVVAHPNAALAAYLQERPALFPGFKVEGQGVTELSAGRLRQRVPRPARRDQQERAEVRRLQGREARRGRRPERRRGRVRPPPQPGLRRGQDPGRLARPHRRRPSRAAAEAAADVAALDRPAPPEGGAERAPLRDGAVAPQRPLADRGVRSGHRSLDGRDQGDRQLPDLRPEARGREAELLRAALQGDARDAPPEPGDRWRLSHRLDLQADHRRGRAERRDHYAGHAALLHRCLRPRRHDLPQRRSGSQCVDDPADGARGVVRHVVLPARRPRLQTRSEGSGHADPELGAQARPRTRAARRLDRARRPATSPGRAGSSRGGSASPGRKGRRSTSRSARAPCR